MDSQDCTSRSGMQDTFISDSIQNAMDSVPQCNSYQPHIQQAEALQTGAISRAIQGMNNLHLSAPPLPCHLNWNYPLSMCPVECPRSQTYEYSFPHSQNIQVTLENEEMWQSFLKLPNEMVITRPGRRMFPLIKAKIFNLDPEAYYFVILDIIPADDHGYKYVKHKWHMGKKANENPPSCIYIHPDSPARGEHWMQQPAVFSKLKLTNSNWNKKGHIVLNSMQRYLARLLVVQGSDVTHLPSLKPNIFPLPQTTFIAVTAYQNKNVTNLKIQHNQFARGFQQKSNEKRSSDDVSESKNDILESDRNKRQKLSHNVTSSIIPPNAKSSLDVGTLSRSSPVPVDHPINVQVPDNNFPQNLYSQDIYRNDPNRISLIKEPYSDSPNQNGSKLPPAASSSAFTIPFHPSVNMTVPNRFLTDSSRTLQLMRSYYGLPGFPQTPSTPMTHPFHFNPRDFCSWPYHRYMYVSSPCSLRYRKDTHGVHIPLTSHEIQSSLNHPYNTLNNHLTILNNSEDWQDNSTLATIDGSVNGTDDTNEKNP